MAPSVSLSSKSKLDLRASVFTRLRKRIGIGWLRVIILVLLDAILLSLAWQLAETYGTKLNSPWNTQSNPFSIVVIVATEVCLIAAGGLYESGEKRRKYFSLIKNITFAHVLLLIIAFLYQPGNFVSRSTFILAWLFSVSLACVGRFGFDTALKHLHQKGTVRCNTFLICPSEDREKAVKLLGKEKYYNILGWTDVDSLAADRQSLDDTLQHICSLGVAEVFICYLGALESRMFLYWKLRNAGITLHVMPIGLETFCQKSEIRNISGIPSIQLSPPLITGSDFFVKRCFDFCFSALFVLATLPIYLGIALLIKLDSPGPIFYKQTRIGLHGQPFKVWKFRTMVANADQIQKELEAKNEMKDGVLFKMKNDPRITRLGKVLRRYSLDELPQLFNVLRGEMSLVGPRPLPMRDVEKFSPHHFIRHEVLPGITGLWQVSGRSDITDFEKVVHLDVTYIESWSLSLDLQILLQTTAVILGKKGAY